MCVGIVSVYVCVVQLFFFTVCIFVLFVGFFFQPKRVLLCTIKMYATLDTRHPVWAWNTIKMIPLERENMCYFLLQPFVKFKTSLCKTALWNKAQVSWSRSSFTQALLLVPPGKISWCTIFLRSEARQRGVTARECFIHPGCHLGWLVLFYV